MRARAGAELTTRAAFKRAAFARAAFARAALACALVGVALAPRAASAQLAPAVDPSAPQITTRTEKSKVQLGEPFKLIIVVLHKADMSVDLPTTIELGDAWAELANRETMRSQEQDGLVKRTFSLTIGALETGLQTVPGISLGYEVDGEHRQITTTPQSVEVTSLVGASKEELRPVAQPVAIMQRDWTPLWVLGGVLGAGLVGGAFWMGLRAAQRRRPGHRARSGKTAPPLPPHEAALLRLRTLAASGKLDVDDRRPVYFELSEILREYLGARFGFDALELTTAELLTALSTRAPADVTRDMDAWLRAGDLVRYARVPTGRDEAAAALAQAVAVVERTRPVAPVAPVTGDVPTVPTEPPPAPPPREAIG